MKNLRLVHPASLPEGDPSGVRCSWELRGSLLEAAFEVRSPRIRANEAFGRERSQEGLWDWDVVELFLSVNGSPSGLPYHEFQVSPLDQFFELKVLEPRRRVDRGFASGFRHSARQDGAGGWSATLSIPLDRLGWGGDPGALRGGFFSILGEPGKKTYWSLFLPPQETPDFHLPELFAPLIPDTSFASGR